MSRYVNAGGAAGEIYAKASATDFDGEWIPATSVVPFRSDSNGSTTAYSTDGTTWVDSGIEIAIPGEAAGERWLVNTLVRFETDRGIDLRFTQFGTGWAGRLWNDGTIGIGGTPAVEQDSLATAGFNWGGTTGIYAAHRMVQFWSLLFTNGNDGALRLEYKSGGSSGAGSGARLSTGCGIWAWRAPFTP